MPRLNYPLKKYEKAVIKIAEQKGFADVVVTPTKGSTVRFELFEMGMEVPCAIWVIHHAHNKKKEIWSKDDYRKAANRLNCTTEEFVETIKSL